MQLFQCRILTDIKGGEVVLVAPQPFQHRILTDIKGGELVFVAAQPFQRRILTDIKGGELVTITVQGCQCRIPTDVKGGELVIAAIQSLQCNIFADIKSGEAVSAAVQHRQRRKILNPVQAGNVFPTAINLGHRRNLRLIQLPIPVFIKGGNNRAEIGVREVSCIDRYRVQFFPHRIQCNVGIGRIGAARLVLRRRSRRTGRPAKEVVSRAGRLRHAQSQGYILGLGLRQGCPAAAIGIVDNAVGGRRLYTHHIKGHRHRLPVPAVVSIAYFINACINLYYASLNRTAIPGFCLAYIKAPRQF